MSDNIISAEYLIIGSGIAGIRAAIELSSNNVMEILLQAAEENRVDVLPLSGVRPAEIEAINGNDYLKVNFSMKPTGTLPEILNFIDAMETGNIGGEKYGTLVISGVTISGKGGAWSANFKGSIYSRIGT